MKPHLNKVAGFTLVLYEQQMPSSFKVFYCQTDELSQGASMQHCIDPFNAKMNGKRWCSWTAAVKPIVLTVTVKYTTKEYCWKKSAPLLTLGSALASTDWRDKVCKWSSNFHLKKYEQIFSVLMVQSSCLTWLRRGSLFAGIKIIGPKKKKELLQFLQALLTNSHKTLFDTTCTSLMLASHSELDTPGVVPSSLFDAAGHKINSWSESKMELLRAGELRSLPGTS